MGIGTFKPACRPAILTDRVEGALEPPYVDTAGDMDPGVVTAPISIGAAPGFWGFLVK